MWTDDDDDDRGDEWKDGGRERWLSIDALHRLPEEVRWEVTRHYWGLQSDIVFELEVADIPLQDHDYGDDDLALFLCFATDAHLEMFLAIADFYDHPSGEDWSVWREEDGSIEVGISRIDLFALLHHLEEVNSIEVDQYERKKEELIERYQIASDQYFEEMRKLKENTVDKLTENRAE